jgi:hypothetical protein
MYTSYTHILHTHATHITNTLQGRERALPLYTSHKHPPIPFKGRKRAILPLKDIG